MIRATFTLPPDLWQWLRGYAAMRQVSRSRVVSDVLTEKRAVLAKEAREDQVFHEAARRIHRPR
jgi:hypothetical protein